MNAIRISFRRAILLEVERAARARRIPIRAFVEQTIEASIASNRLRVLPPPMGPSPEERAAVRERVRTYREKQKALISVEK